MAIIVHGYSVNQIGEASDWSPREFALLSAFAGLMPTSGTRIIDGVSAHSHTFLTDTSGNYILTATPTGISASSNISAFGDILVGGGITADYLISANSILATENLVAGEDIFTIFWQSYTPDTISGWLGGATSAFYYKQVGDLVFVKFGINGTGDDKITTIRLPFSTNDNWVFPQMFQGFGIDPITAFTRMTSANPTILSNDVLICGTTSWGESTGKYFCGELWYIKA